MKSCYHSSSQIHLPLNLNAFQMMLKVAFTSLRTFHLLRMYKTGIYCLILFQNLSPFNFFNRTNSVRETDWSVEIAELIVSNEWKCPNCDTVFYVTGIQKLQHSIGKNTINFS